MISFLTSLFFAAAPAPEADKTPIRIPIGPALSPDGRKIAFAWKGEVWTAPLEGGEASALTMHPAIDGNPVWSPDGKQIAFMSFREGSPHAYVIPSGGGQPRQVGFHSEGYRLTDWYPDGRQLMCIGLRDRGFSNKTSERLIKVDTGRNPTKEEMIFDDYGDEARVSPDGGRILFVREGSEKYRKGYRGSQAAQIWLYEMASKKFSPILQQESDCRSPAWGPDGRSFYYINSSSGIGNIHRFDLDSRKDEKLTDFKTESASDLCISRDGSRLVFRQLFDLMSLDPRNPGRGATAIPLWTGADLGNKDIQQLRHSKANDFSFSSDGLELSFSAGGDIAVSDTVLKEPSQVSSGAAWDTEPVFGRDADAIFFLREDGRRSQIVKASRADEKLYWWQNREFKFEVLFEDSDTLSDMQLTPEGKQLIFLKGPAIWKLDLQNGKSEALISCWEKPDYDLSPDGKWIAWAVRDADYNSEIWIAPLDGSRDPLNISRHPRDDFNPRWSPDGAWLAYVGCRNEGEPDIVLCTLDKSRSEVTRRDKLLEKAVETMKKGRSSRQEKAPEKPAEKSLEKSGDKGPEKPAEKTPRAPKAADLKIDFDGLHDRRQTLSLPNMMEGSLVWSGDSRKLYFRATQGSLSDLRDPEAPKKQAAQLMSLEIGDTQSQIKQVLAQDVRPSAWLRCGALACSSDGVPSLLRETQLSQVSFTFLQDLSVSGFRRATFTRTWRLMRDQFYDETMKGLDWPAIFDKYEPLAKSAADEPSFDRVVNMMLGELNASHMGWRSNFIDNLMSLQRPDNVTAHLGLIFDSTWAGPGLRVERVVPKGPADLVKAGIDANDLILSIAAKEVGPKTELSSILNGLEGRDVDVLVQNARQEKRHVVLRPINYRKIRNLLYEEWIENNRKAVAARSDDRIGYLHVAKMQWSEFRRFEEEVFAEGSGRDALIVDVRENGGGFTTDHLLSVLCPNDHAICRSRGSGLGYPIDRLVYATWSKPVIVLCNQNSFSNAEVFTHAIQVLKRGRVVGVPTAGGVISTGSAKVLGAGTLRMPGRGWYRRDNGEDQELAGAVPDIIVWPWPGDLSTGRDVQLDKAVDLALEDAALYKSKPAPKLRKASER
ncbi:MAG: Tricorn protease protein [Verrucomicrobiota bacterium]|jgi:tricorn protease